jgi:vacuolar-type H+-ATPase subunit F/Vma7
MSRIAVIGESPRVDAWALAGALVLAATGPEQLRYAWDRLPDDVEVVVVTPTAAASLPGRTVGRLIVVMP